MKAVRRGLLAASVAAALLASAGPRAWACSIPVFRYALERWPAEPYEAVVFHKGPLAGEAKAALDELRSASAGQGVIANIEVRTADLAGVLDKELDALWRAQAGAEPPWLVVHYPASLRVEQNAWAGKLTTAAARSLLNSPARAEIARHLANGYCASWLLVESGDKAQDNAAAKVLKEELAKLEKTLELPSTMDAGLEPEPPEVDDGNQDPPQLKVAFGLVRVSPSAPAEQAFLDTIFSLEPEFKKAGKPLAFAVFGQGRALPPLVGEGINAENIADVCSFVVGPCSCQVKAMNPGWDLLMAADWAAAVSGELVKDPEPPELAGSVPTPLAKAAAKLPPPPAPFNPAPPEPRRATLLRNVFLAVAGGVVLLAIVSAALMRKRRG